MFFGKNEREALSGIQKSCQDFPRLMEETGNRIDALEKTAGKHDVVLEDLSDTLSELREQEENALESLHREVAALREERLGMEQDQEEKLLELLMEYENHLLMLEALLSDKEGWKEQFVKIHERIRQKCLPAGVTILGEAGEPVDYGLHEVIDVRKTSDPELDRHVAQVYERGILYKGHIRKARISAWKEEEK